MNTNQYKIFANQGWSVCSGAGWSIYSGGMCSGYPAYAHNKKPLQICLNIGGGKNAFYRNLWIKSKRKGPSQVLLHFILYDLNGLPFPFYQGDLTGPVME